MQNELFDRLVDVDDPNTLRNLSETAATKTTLDTFRHAVNALTISDTGTAEVRDTIKLRNVRPFVAKDQPYVVAKRSIFNKIVGDSPLELAFAAFLEKTPAGEVASYAKNCLAVGFKLDYVKADGNLSSYIPDFLVKLHDGRTIVIETKSQEELDLPQKMARLRQWCVDANAAVGSVTYDFMYVDQPSFEQYQPTSILAMLQSFVEYKT